MHVEKKKYKKFFYNQFLIYKLPLQRNTSSGHLSSIISIFIANTELSTPIPVHYAPSSSSIYKIMWVKAQTN